MAKRRRKPAQSGPKLTPKLGKSYKAEFGPAGTYGYLAAASPARAQADHLTKHRRRFCKTCPECLGQEKPASAISPGRPLKVAHLVRNLTTGHLPPAQPATPRTYTCPECKAENEIDGAQQRHETGCLFYGRLKSRRFPKLQPPTWHLDRLHVTMVKEAKVKKNAQAGYAERVTRVRPLRSGDPAIQLNKQVPYEDPPETEVLARRRFSDKS